MGPRQDGSLSAAKKKKKAKKPGPAASQSSGARALAKERAKMKAMRGGAKASNKAVVASTKQPQPLVLAQD